MENARTEQEAIFYLARWMVGGTPEDLDTAQAFWPDLPDDRDLAKDWLIKQNGLAESLARVDPEGSPPGGPPLETYLLSADQILTTEWPEPVWAVPDLLPAGLTILAGKPKTGKSWLALQLAQSVATGGMALDRKVEVGPVLYLALEDPPRRLADRMQTQGWPAGSQAHFMAMGEFVDHVGDLRKGGGPVLAQQIERAGYRLVVIDTLSRAVGGDQSDVQEMTAALAPLQAVAQRLNMAVVMIDHHRKGFGMNPDAIMDILGSTAKGALADCVWGLYRERGKAGAKLQVTGRDVIEQTLALTFDGRLGCWQCEGDAYALELTERRQEILDALQGSGRAALGDIVEYVDQPKSHTHSRLQDLANEGLVLRIEQGRRVFYDLPEDELPL